MRKRLNLRMALVFACACPVACTPAAQQQLAGPLAKQTRLGPQNAAHRHAHHQHHHRHHHTATHATHHVTDDSHQPADRHAKGHDSAHHHHHALRHFSSTDPAHRQPSETITQTAAPEATFPIDPDDLLRPLDSALAADPSPPSAKNEPSASASTGHPGEFAENREFAHAADYSWVQGRLEYRHRTDQWRIRFAPHWLEDRFGGSLALQGSEETQASWHEGERVRLWGTVKGDDPVYEVDRTDLLQPDADTPQS